jgi:microcystin-dependent protein
MSEPYVGEIRLFAGNFAPVGWELCQGQLLPVSDNETLFQLLGTSYGGDGTNTFALPDLRGRVPVHAGTGAGLTPRILAEGGGAESVALNTSQMAAHTHLVSASQDPASSDYNAATGLPATAIGTNVYGALGTPGPMLANAIGAAGGAQAHDNMGPYLCLNFIISLFGIYPTPD